MDSWYSKQIKLPLICEAPVYARDQMPSIKQAINIRSSKDHERKPLQGLRYEELRRFIDTQLAEHKTGNEDVQNDDKVQRCKTCKSSTIKGKPVHVLSASLVSKKERGDQEENPDGAVA